MGGEEMNKQEAIEKIKNIGTLNIYDKVAGQQVDTVIKNEVLDIISQIQEPRPKSTNLAFVLIVLSGLIGILIIIWAIIISTVGMFF
jgi:hypothetical protein